MSLAHVNGGAPSPSIRRRANLLILRQVKKLSEDRIIDTASLIGDLGCDSLDVVELQFAAEEEFHIEITDRDAEGMRTVRDFHAIIEKKLGLS